MSAEPGNDDRERTLTAALEAVIGALLALPGMLLRGRPGVRRRDRAALARPVRGRPRRRGGPFAVTLDDLARGARRMIAAALEAEVDEYVGSFVDEVGEDGRRLVVRNGHARASGA